MSNSFLDTNVIVRHLLQDHPDHSLRSSKLIDQIAKGKRTVWITDTVVFETVFVLNQIYEVPRPDIAHELAQLLQIPGIQIASRVEMLRSLELWVQETPLSFADCYHLVTAKSLGLSEIYSFDKKMGRYPGVDRVEPE
jgi:predicted nucleic acid-binding protein